MVVREGCPEQQYSTRLCLAPLSLLQHNLSCFNYYMYNTDKGNTTASGFIKRIFCMNNFYNFTRVKIFMKIFIYLYYKHKYNLYFINI